ncbi:hypothetical protein BGW41_002937 [Actinomortierella wolfii]|nr:hypothetical protein BGW41_002937 [Actinomortierella wolfii]
MSNCAVDETAGLKAMEPANAFTRLNINVARPQQPSLPTDILLVIFSKLDAPSLLQATLVCRQWYRLVSQYSQSLWRDLAIRDFTFTAPRSYWKLELKPETCKEHCGLARLDKYRGAKSRQRQQRQPLHVQDHHDQASSAKHDALKSGAQAVSRNTEDTTPSKPVGDPRRQQGLNHSHKHQDYNRCDWKALYRQTSNWYRGRARGYCPILLPSSTSQTTTSPSDHSNSSSSSSASSKSSTTASTSDIINWLLRDRRPEAVVGLQHEGSASTSISLTPRPANARNVLDHDRVILRSNPHYRRHVPRSAQAQSFQQQEQQQGIHQPNIMVQDPLTHDKIAFAISSANPKDHHESATSEPTISAPPTNSPSEDTTEQEPHSPQPMPASADPMNDIDSTICVWEINPDPSKPSPSHGTIHSASYLTSTIPGLDDWISGIEHICVGDSLVACSTESSGSVLVFSLATGSLVYEIPGLYQPSKICMTEFFLLTGGRGTWNQSASDRGANVVEYYNQRSYPTSPTATTPTIEISMMEAGLAGPTAGATSPSFNNGSEQPLPNGWWGHVQQLQGVHTRHHSHMTPHQTMRAPAVEVYTTCCINVWDLRTGQRLYSLIPRLPIQPDPVMSSDELLHAIQKRAPKSKKMHSEKQALVSRNSRGKGKQVQPSPFKDQNNTQAHGKAYKALVSKTSYSPDLTSSGGTFEQQPNFYGMSGSGAQQGTYQHETFSESSSVHASSLSSPVQSSPATKSSNLPSTSSSATASTYSTPGYGSNAPSPNITSDIIPGLGAGPSEGRFASPSIPSSSSFSPSCASSSATVPHNPHPHAYPLNLSTGARARRGGPGPTSLSSSSSSSPKTPASPIPRPLTLLDMTVTPDHSTLIVALCARWGHGHEGVYAWDFSGTRLEGYHDDGEENQEEEDEEEDDDDDWSGESIKNYDADILHIDERESEAESREVEAKGAEDGEVLTEEQIASPLSTAATATCKQTEETPAGSSQSFPMGLKNLRVRRNDLIMQQVSTDAFAAFHQARITGKVWVGWKAKSA